MKCCDHRAILCLVTNVLLFNTVFILVQKQSCLKSFIPPRRAEFSRIFARSELRLSRPPGHNWHSRPKKRNQIFVIEGLRKVYTKGEPHWTNTDRDIGDLLHHVWGSDPVQLTTRPKTRISEKKTSKGPSG